MIIAVIERAPWDVVPAEAETTKEGEEEEENPIGQTLVRGKKGPLSLREKEYTAPRQSHIRGIWEDARIQKVISWGTGEKSTWLLTR